MNPLDAVEANTPRLSDEVPIDMTPSEALAILGLHEGVDEPAVKEAYRRLSLESHPDRPGGDTAEQAKINDAYDIAMSMISPDNSLTVRTAQSLRRVESALLIERSARQVDTEAKAIKRRRRRPLHRVRNISLMVGIATGLLLLSVDYVSEPLLETASEGLRRILKLNLGIFAVVLGGAALWMQMKVQQLENAIEACTEDLLDRRFCAERLAKILEYKDARVVSENDLYGMPRHATPVNDLYRFLDRATPLPSLSMFGFGAPLSEDDFRRLLLPKAVEHRLLEPIEPQQLDPETAIGYRLLFRPSVFQPKPESPTEPPKPQSRESARFQALGCGIVAAILIALAIYLILKKTWWVLLPGFVCVVSMIMVLDGITAWLAAIRRAKGEES